MNAVTKISERAKRLIRPREKFLVLEVLPAGTNALFLSVDEDRNLIFEKFVNGADLKKFLQSPLRKISQKSWEGNYLFKKARRKIIVSADPSLATTMPIPLDLSRDRSLWKSEIALTELENLIAQAMAKIFTQCRKEASKRLGVDDIHTILVGAKADRFKIDGHVVMNPIDFTGKKISLLLELTFTSRPVFENLKQFFNSPDEFFFVESSQAWLLSVSRARKLPLNLIAASGASGKNAAGGDGPPASLFVFQKAEGEHPVLYREHFDWSFGSIFKGVADELGVDLATAKELYRAYRSGELSESAERNFKKAIQPAVDGLLAAAERAKLNGFVYIDTPHLLPFDLPHKHKGMTFEELPIEAILTELALQPDAEMSPEKTRAAFRHLAPFLEAYFAKSTSEINQKLRRRLHWLAE